MVGGNTHLQALAAHKHQPFAVGELTLQIFCMAGECEARLLHKMLVDRSGHQGIYRAVFKILHSRLKRGKRSGGTLFGGLPELDVESVGDAVYNIDSLGLGVCSRSHHIGTELLRLFYKFFVEAEHFGRAVDHRDKHIHHPWVGQGFDYNFVSYSVGITLSDSYCEHF